MRRHALAAGLVGGLLLSLMWMLVLRYSAGLLAWLVVLVVTVLFVACTLLAFTKVSSLASPQPPACRLSRVVICTRTTALWVVLEMHWGVY